MVLLRMVTRADVHRNGRADPAWAQEDSNL